MIQKLTENTERRLIGYARVSTDEQHLDLQLDALKEAGCVRIFTDQGISAVSKKREGFEKALGYMHAGDVLVIWKMDRAFRSLKHALDTLEALENQKIEFVSLTEQIDTTTAMGRCMYQIRNAFAELERNLISERTKAGMLAAKKRGKKIGRPRKLSQEQIQWARCLLASNPNMGLNALAENLGVSSKTLKRSLIENS